MVKLNDDHSHDGHMMTMMIVMMTLKALSTTTTTTMIMKTHPGSRPWSPSRR
jgi:hypothetical protein